jgi:hypothetical protein
MLLEQQTMRTVQVRATDTDTLVTAIEILSPVNKRGDGLHTYQEKRRSLLRSDVHFIELDCCEVERDPGGKSTIHRWHVIMLRW